MEFIRKSGKESVIVFIHGFTGGHESWENSQSKHFGDILLENAAISQNYDIAEFIYYTKLTGIAHAYELAKAIFGLKGKVGKSVSIGEIAQTFASDIEYNLSTYKNIVLIAHSMGGLIAKSYLANNDDSHKIRSFFSLAVPHSGSTLATYGKTFFANANIKELEPLSSIIDRLNRDWVSLKNRPETFFLYGIYDEIVPKASAYPIDLSDQNLSACPHNHSSIAKPEDENDNVIKICVAQLSELSKKNFLEKELVHKTVEDETIYDDNLYVLKLLISKIDAIAVSQSKELFYNADYAAKLYSKYQDDCQNLLALYSRIKAIYVSEFLKLQGGSTNNSSELLAKVYDRIRAEDNTSLKTALHAIDHFHKAGMLHQLADNKTEKIWWDKNQSMADIESYKKSNG